MLGRSPARDAAALASLHTTLDSLTARGAHVLVIGPLPLFPYPAAACVVRRGEEKCRVSRGEFERATAGSLPVPRGAVRRHANARLWEPASAFCDDRWCYPARRGRVTFRDDDHLTPYGAESAVPQLAPYLEWLTGMRPGASQSFVPRSGSALR